MNFCEGKTIDRIFRDEKGITTVAMAVSILVSLALIFTGAQAYKVTSASAEIQEVADACSLAAESEVAEFLVVVKVCDATVLTMSLFAGASLGLGVVCACVPPLEGVSNSLVNIGNKALKARNNFADKAETGLNKLQQALPFLAAAAASSVASANNAGAMSCDYSGCAFLLPQQGDKIQVGSITDLEESAEDINDEISDIQKKAKEAEEAAEDAQEAKLEAFKLDCGNSPGYCQYERAGRFDWMPSSENPYYSNVDAWSFSVAFERAKSYYGYREGRESEPSGSVQEKASYFVRMRFYSYAYQKLETEGYVYENGTSFSANFPKLYKNLEEFRQTSLYTSAQFPVSQAEGEEKATMHAWNGCPSCTEVSGYDCIAALDSDVYVGCETCNFSVESLGNVASASTNISNGFEYHYDRIRQQAEKYQEAIERVSPLTDELKGIANPLFDSLTDALKSIGGCRISANPCGSVGAVAIVVNKAENSSDEGFENLFVSNAGTLGTRVAVSGAALVEDTSDSSADVINTLLDSFSEDSGTVVGGAGLALDLWSSLLKTYEKGQQSLEKAISSTISTISLGTLSGLGEWAAEAFEDVISSVGLEPANLNVMKPAVLNTGHLASNSNDTFAVNYRKLRSQTISASSSSGNIFQGISTWISNKFEAISESEITIAEIEFPVGGALIPITISLPGSITKTGEGTLQACIGSIESLVAGSDQKRVWQ